MFRIIVGVLAAFVGFSFGHSIPKWMENKSKSATEMQDPSSSEPSRPVRKLLLRRKSLRKFKFSSQRSGKDNVECNGSPQKSSKDDAEDHGSLQNLKLVPSSLLCAGSLNARVHAEQRKKFRFGSQKSPNDKIVDQSTIQGIDSGPNVLLSAANFEHGRRSLQELCANSDNMRHTHQEKCTNSDNGCHPHHQSHTEDVLSKELKPREPVFCKISSTQSMCGSPPPAKERSQMKQWKMKLMSLRSKAMVSEKVWYQKFENENFGGKLLALSPKKMAKGKENENPQLMSAKKRDLSWSRSSSKVGLLVEGPKSAFER